MKEINLADFFNKFNDYPETLVIYTRDNGHYVPHEITEGDGDEMDELVMQYQNWTVIDFNVGFEPSSYIWIEVIGNEQGTDGGKG